MIFRDANETRNMRIDIGASEWRAIARHVALLDTGVESASRNSGSLASKMFAPVSPTGLPERDGIRSDR
jgi:hypothetical protein